MTEQRNTGDGREAALPAEERERLLGGPPRERAGLALAYLRRLAARVLALDPARLEAGGPLLALGLDSLAAAEITGAVEEDLGVQLPPAGLLEGASLGDLAAEIATALAAPRPGAAPEEGPGRHPPSWGQRALWLFDGLVPGGNPACVIAGAARLAPGWDRGRLRRALQGVVDRHAALRTTFEPATEEAAGCVRVVHAAAAGEWREESAAGCTAAALAERVAAAAHRPFDLARGPLLRAVVIDTGGEEADGPVLVLAVHHIVADFGSLGVMLRDLGALYRGEPPAAPAPSYGGFVREEALLLAGAEGERLRRYWHETLGGRGGGAAPDAEAGLPALALPADRARPALPSFAGGARRLRLAGEIQTRLEALGARAGATPFMVLLAGFMTLLHRLSGQERLLVGVPASLRGAPERADMVGYLVNPVAVRGDLGGEPAFAELLQRVREAVLGAFAHRDYPFARLAEELGGGRGAGRSPLFQAMFVLYHERGPAERGLGRLALGEAGERLDLGGGLTLRSRELACRASQFDLMLQMASWEGGLAGLLQHSGELFDGATVERWAAHLGALLAAVGEPAPAAEGGGEEAAGERVPIGALPLLTAAERQQLREWNDTAAELARGAACHGLHELIEEQARRTPDAVAVEAPAESGGPGDPGGPGAWHSLTYGELDRRAEALARRLSRLGVGRETVVAVCADRSVALMIGLLAILKAGGAYLPLDSSHPAERLSFMMRDGGARLLLAQRRLSEAVVARLDPPPGGTVWLDGEAAAPGPRPAWRAGPQAPPGAAGAAAGAADGAVPGPRGGGRRSADPDQLAYVIYTSGSTGRPKGVMNRHRGVVNRLLWGQERFRLAADDRVLQKTPVGFDVSVWELFWPLLAGARLVMAHPGGHRDSAYLWRLLASHQVTTAHFVPAMLAAFLDEPGADSGREGPGPGRGEPRPGEAGEGPGRSGRGSLPALRRVLASGEALPFDLERRYHDRLAAPLFNLYGPTEAAVEVTCWAADPAGGPRLVPIGRPVANTRILLLGPKGGEVPIGVAGELHIGGVQVARGYLGRAGLTAERFVPDPSGGPGARLYRTGDLARFLPDGTIDFLGRLDTQVKIRGFRIELGEIEAALRGDPAVRDAVVVARAGAGTAARPAAAAKGAPPAELRLVAYLVPGPAWAGPAWADPGAPGGAAGAEGAAASADAAAASGDGAASANGAVALRDGAAPAASRSAALISRVRQGLRRSLPEHMVPAAFVVLPALPLTASGKVDRRALPAPERETGGGGGAARTAPGTGTERRLARLWADLLPLAAAGEAEGEGEAPVAVEDSFFELGGHSLLATRLIARVRQVFGVELGLHQVFAQPTLAAMARWIEAAGAARAERPVEETGVAPPGTAPVPPPLGRRPPGAAAPLSYAQERIRFLAQLTPQSVAYNLCGAVALDGPLDARGRAALAWSLGQIRRRHEVLRTVYPAAAGGEGTAAQVVLADDPRHPPALPWVDLSGLGGERGAAEAARLAALVGRLPFDLGRGPLLRPALLRLAPRHHRLVLALHHIAADGWSVGIFLRELSLLLGRALDARAAGAPPLPELPLQYGDYAHWQRSWLHGRALDLLLAHWRQALAGAPAQLALPADRPRPAVPSYRGAVTSLVLPAAEAAALLAGARRHGASLFMVLLAAFDVLLGRLSGQEDIVVGSPIANRERLEIEGLIGCFVNTLALRVGLAGRPSFAGLLERVRQATLGAYAHQDMPFEKLVEDLAPERELGATPLFQAMLVLQNSWSAAELAAAGRLGGGLRLELGEVGIGTAKFDLTLQAAETPAGLALAFEHSTDLFDAATAARLAGHYRNLLGALAGGTATPAGGVAGAAGAADSTAPASGWERAWTEIPWLSPAERQQLREWNATTVEYPAGACLHELIEQQARRSPDAVAVLADREEELAPALSYGELNARANRLARHLAGLGVGPESVVAIAAERSLAMIVGLVAILKAGAAYLPLDPGYPRERLLYMLEDSGARLLLTQGVVGGGSGGGVGGGGGERLDAPGTAALRLDDPAPPWARRSAGDLSRGATGVTADNLAYVIYTSGSTGRPKGTLNRHRGIVNRLLWGQERFRLEADDRVLQKTPASFDVSVWELFWPLVAGARLVLARPGGQRDSGYLLEALAAQAITTAHFVPAMMRVFLDDLASRGEDGAAAPADGGGLPGLRRVLSSGEALPPDLQEQWAARFAAPLFNLYGPTEAAVEVTFWACDPAGPRRLVPIGRPVANTRIHLLDRHGGELPIGVPGELHIGGVQVARGYGGRPGLTAERFVPDPFGEPGARMYRSGDLARRLPDGAIDFLGRADAQVKIRGFRIELGEIEAALLRHPGVREAAVAAMAAGAERALPGGGPEGAGAERRLVAYLVPATPWMPAPAAMTAPAAPTATTASAAAPGQGAPAAAGAPQVLAAEPLIAAVRAALQETLPEHMLPAAFVALSALPLSPSGKVDRRALPPPPAAGAGRGAAGAERAAPHTAVERRLARLWTALLGLEESGGGAVDPDAARPFAVALADSFFDLGGHSLLATRLVSRVRQAFGVELPLRRVFERPALGAMAAEIEALGPARERGTAAGPAGAGGGRGPALPPPAGEDGAAELDAPLSYPQERIWFVEQLTPGTAAYNLPGCVRLRGQLDGRGRAVLAAALGHILRRHDVLRTVFLPPAAGAEEAGPRQRVLARAACRLPLIDLAALGGAAAAEARRRCAVLGRQPFDLAAGPLLRLALLRLGPEEHLLLLVLHHIAGDGWSVTIFLRELAALYAAGAAAAADAGLPELPMQYADFSRWQRAHLNDERLEELLAYWRPALAGAPPQLLLPADRPRPAAASFRGGLTVRTVPAALGARLGRGARERRVTLFMALLAVFDLVLARATGQSDIVVGSPVANRERLEHEPLIGCFVNALALRAETGDLASFDELLTRVREVCLQAFAHQDMPFEKLVQALAPPRDLGVSPIFQVLLVLQNAWDHAGRVIAAGDLTMEAVEVELPTAKFDLTLAAVEKPRGIVLSFEHAADLFDGATIKRLAGHFETVLAALAGGDDAWAGNLADLPWLSVAERHQLSEWNATAARYPAGPCLHGLIAEQARRTPDAVAVTTDPTDSTDSKIGAECLSYEALDDRAGRLARLLRDRGAGAESVVAIAAERSLALAVGLVAILKAGGAYLPLDPDYPDDRLLYMLRDSGARVLLAQGALAARLAQPGLVTLDLDGPSGAGAAVPPRSDVAAAGPPRSDAAAAGLPRSDAAAAAGPPWPDVAPAAPPLGDAACGPDNLAYVIYTSGSTGRPKGTMNSHRGIVNRLLWMQEQYGLRADDRVLQKTPASFDVSVWELFWPLLAGARLVMARPGGHRDPAYLRQAIARHDITTLHFVPAMLAAFLDGDPAPAPPLPSLRRVMASGEALPHELQQRWHERSGAPLHNLYGPTEAAVDVTFWACDPASARRLVPIGRPVANTRILLLDREGRQVPIGVAAELHIGGVQLARGYLGRPDLTADRFGPDPGGTGERLYRTGDLARLLPDGAIDYLGRADAQVKIRGIRVELGEIEAALAAHPAVAAAAVVLREQGGAGAVSGTRGAPAHRRLVAYVVVRPDDDAGASGAGSSLAAELRQSAAGRLPEHMVPSAFVFLPRLPLTPSGKLDRKALLAVALPPAAPAESAGGQAAPRTPTEELLADIWAELLGVAAVGPGDDFFSLGGHSLLATQLISRVREVFGRELVLRQVFERPTLAALAREIAASESGAAAVPPLLRLAGGPAELSYAQERLWFLHHLAPASGAYNLPGGILLSGRLDPSRRAALAAALGEIVRRHEVLRTTYPPAADGSGRPRLAVQRHRPVELPMIDLAALGEGAAAAGRALGARLGHLPIDLAAGPVMRAALLRLGPESHLLIVVIHHIAADGWSIGVFSRELTRLFTAFAAGLPSPLPELALQYSDYARWQRSWLEGAVMEGHLGHWRQTLAGAPTLLALPTDRPRPALQGFRGASVTALVPEDLVAELARDARRAGATLFMVLLAVLDVLLQRLTGQDDLVVGSPIANRERLEVEGLIGCFVNTLALRVGLAGRPSLPDLLKRVRQVCLAAYAHQDLPFERLVEALAPRRELATTPLFQVMLVLQNAGRAAAPAGRGPVAAPPLAMAACRLPSTSAKLDLMLSAAEQPDGLAVDFEYRRDLFDAATVRRLAEQYRTLLAAVAGRLGDRHLATAALPLLGPAERHQLLEWNETAAAAAVPLSAGAELLHELFERQARRRPEAPAVAGQGMSLTHGELEAGANRLARVLRRRGVGPETRVGLCVERSPRMVVALLGILKAGGAYVPLDPSHPPERLTLIARDSACAVVVTEEGCLSGGHPGPGCGAVPSSAAAGGVAGGSSGPSGDGGDRGDSGDGDGGGDDLTPPGLPRAIVRLDGDAAEIGAEPGEPLPASAAAENLAYLIYTSGSTGRPKGVAVAHRSAVAALRAMAGRPGLAATDAMAALTTLAFDISVLEIFLPLAAGARVEVMGREEAGQGRRLARRLAESRTTALQATPATWRLLLDAGWSGQPGLRAVSGGEALSAELAARLLATGAELWNAYGPTETTIYSSVTEVAPDLAAGGEPTLGRPLDGERFFVVDRDGERVPAGVAGELLIGGAGVARGYWARPGLTAERFLPDAWSGEAGARLYRTGDLVRFRADGRAAYLGRIDHQVKVRGFRIELGEIEAALLRLPEVAEAVVVARGEEADRRLIAYLRPALPAPAPTPAALRERLQRELPHYMVPAAFVSLDRLPLTPSGKVDRQRLPAPDWGQAGGAAAGRRAAPRGAGEERVARLWAEVLGVERVGADDNFFDLGGHSLLLARLHARLEQVVGREFPLLDLFVHTTVRAQAEHLRLLEEGSAPAGTGAAGPRSAVATAARPPVPCSDGSDLADGSDRADRADGIDDANGSGTAGPGGAGGAGAAAGQGAAGRAVPVAIVGMAGRFPGARNVEELWQKLRGGADCIARWSDEELLAEGVDPALLGHPRYVRAGGAIDGEDLFDAAFFDYAPREAALLDPQQRVFLECAQEALERAGHDPERFPGAIGVYAGVGISGYFLHNLATNPELLATLGAREVSLANGFDYLTTRVSYKLNLRGPSVDVQTACSTSLVAVHLACQALAAGECDMALAGGSDVRQPQRVGYLHEEGGIESASGVCRAFDAAADGTVWGSGAGVVVLRRLADARAGGDTIHAVILGSAINNDGAGKVGFTAPSLGGQAAAVAAAQRRAGCAPETIGYVECHGTGTPLGDPIEVAALTRAFGTAPARGSCAIGSIKTNLGHLGAAAGVAGLIKAALVLARREIPPSLHFTRPNPRIDLAAGPFFVNTALASWPARPEGPRRAAVSSFGLGGTNAHAVLEEAPPSPAPSPTSAAGSADAAEARPWQVLVLSARSAAALAEATANLAGWLDEEHAGELPDAAFTLQVGRRLLPHRRALVCRGAAEARAALAGGEPRRAWSAHQPRTRRPVVFLFPGQGAQHAAMARGLYDAEPVFRRELDACAELLSPHLGLDLRRALYGGVGEVGGAVDDGGGAGQGGGAEGDGGGAGQGEAGHGDGAVRGDGIDQTWLAQPALFAVEHALAKLWMSWGVRPWAMLGHSVGELVAACLAGVLTLPDALRLVAARGALMQARPAGAMLSVELPEAGLAPWLEPPVELAAVNGPRLSVVAGPAAAVSGLAERLRAAGAGCRLLHASHAFHSAAMEPVMAPLAEILAGMELRPPGIPYLSNLTGDWIGDGEATDPAYWAAHLRRPVRFAAGIERLLAEGADPVFLEVGPGRALGSLVRAVAGGGAPPAAEPAVAGAARAAASGATPSARAVAAPPGGSAAEPAGSGGPAAPPVTVASMRHPRDGGDDQPVLLGALARLWVAGAEIDWQGFHAGARRRRVVLPTYPFQRRRLWVEPGDGGLAGSAGSARPEPGAAPPGTYTWRPAPLPRRAPAGAFAAAPPPGAAAPWLLLLDGLGVGERLARRLEAGGGRAIRVAAGPELAGSPEEGFRIVPGESGHLQRLVEALESRGLRPERAVHLWGLAPGGRRGQASTAAAAPGSVIALAAALAGREWGARCEIVAVGSRLHDLSGGRALASQAALLAACQAASRLPAAPPCRSVDLPAPRTERTRDRLAAWLLQEAGHGSGAAVVAYHPSGHRHVRALAPLPEDVPAAAPAPGGACLVVGEPGRLEGALAALLAARGLVREDAAARSGGARGRRSTVLPADPAALADSAALATPAAPRALAAPVIPETPAISGEGRDGVVSGVVAFLDPPGASPTAMIAGLAELERRIAALDRLVRRHRPGFCMLVVDPGAGSAAPAGALAAGLVEQAAQVRAHDPDTSWIAVTLPAAALPQPLAAAALSRALAAAGACPAVVVPPPPSAAAGRPRRRDEPAAAETAGGPDRTEEAAPALPGGAPRDEIEARLVGIFERLLGTGGIGIHDDFFELGGHSLLGTRLIALVASELAAELPIRALFEAPTPAGLAAEVKRRLVATGRRAVVIEQVRRDGELPASFSQQRLWFLDQLSPGSPLYNLPITVALRGAIAVPALAAALGAVAARHETLRTAFRTGAGGPVQVIAPAAAVPVPVPVPVVDLGGLSGSRPALARALAERIAAAAGFRPFDLGRAPLLRAVLVRLAPAEHLLLLALHHIVSDGWSMGLLIHELSALYASRQAGVPAPLPALPIQYADFAAWQRQRLSGAMLEGELAFWRRTLAGLPALELPTDRPRPAVASSRGASRRVPLPPALAAAVERLCQKERVTPFMALLAAFTALLGLHADQEDFAVGTPVAGRSHAATEHLIGCFVNPLALRGDLSRGPSGAELLRRVRETTLDAFAHQEVPFEHLVGELSPDRDLSRTPLFQVMLSLQSAAVPPPPLPGVAMEIVPLAARTSRFDLTLVVLPTPDGLTGAIDYRTDLFDPATIDRFAGHFRGLLHGLAAWAGRPVHGLPLLSPAERHQLQVEWNDAPWDGDLGGLLHGPFERRAALCPDAVALVERAVPRPDGPERFLTYGRLDGWAGRLAARLRQLGVGPERVAGICVEPGCEMVLGLLAILKAGGAYLPLDPAHPAERQARILADSGAAVVLAGAGLAGRFPAKAAVVPLASPTRGEAPGGGGWADGSERAGGGAAPVRPAAVQPDNAAYVLYTSGSTGLPKGVVITHRSAANRLRFQVASDLAPGARMLQRTRLGFDISVLEIFAPLWMGGTVLLVPQAQQQEAESLARLAAGWQVTNVNVPPVLFPLLLALPSWRASRSLRRVVTGGDRVPGDLPVRYHAALGEGAPRLLARYGPTEATISITEWACGPEPAGQTVPLGRPITGARLHVLDRGQRLVPPGAPGELCVAGTCLARGYLARPDLTAAAFIPDPFADTGEPGTRLYRTGDLVRRRADGVVQFLGRIDGQVKVRGFRIELGEIEAALGAHAAVQAAAVAVHRAGAGAGADLRLVGYVVPRPALPARSPGTAGRAGGRAELLDELRRVLAGRLPDYMVPSELVLLEKLPLTVNGKLDRRALPAPAWGQGGAAATFAAPRGPREEALAALFRELLGVERVGRGDNFFALGGHSLLAVRLVARIREAFGRDLPVAALFRAPTVERLAALLADGSAPPNGRTALVELTAAADLRGLRGLRGGVRGAGRTEGPPPRRRARGRLATRPFFCVHPAGGNVLCYAELARGLGPGQPFFGLQLPDAAALPPTPTIEDLAAHYIAAMAGSDAGGGEAGTPERPHAIGGWSLGGAIAFEMARQLRAEGQAVEPLVLIDPAPLRRGAGCTPTPAARLRLEFLRDLAALSAPGAAVLAGLPDRVSAGRRVPPVKDALPADPRMSDPSLVDLAAAARAAGLLPDGLAAEDLERLFSLFRTARGALDRYRPAPAPGRLTLLLAAGQPVPPNGRQPAHPAAAWAALCGAGAEVESLPGDHYAIVRQPVVTVLAAKLRRLLAGRPGTAGASHRPAAPRRAGQAPGLSALPDG